MAVAQTIPFYGEGFGTFNSETATYSAPGVGTHLGRHDNCGSVIVTPTDDPLVFHFESGDDNQALSGADSLITRFENGLLTLTPVGEDEDTGEPIFTAVWEADSVVVGGTSKFANAQPANQPLHIVAVNEPFKFSDPEWTFQWTLTGKVELGVSRRQQPTPFKVDGDGFAAELPLGPTPWAVGGTASRLGRYTSPAIDSLSANSVQVDTDPRFDPALGRIPFSGSSTFIAANNAELVLEFEGFLTVLPTGGLRWVAEFKPVAGESTGKLNKVVDGSVIMLATSPPPDGNDGPIPFEWFGDGHLTFARGK